MKPTFRVQCRLMGGDQKILSVRAEKNVLYMRLSEYCTRNKLRKLGNYVYYVVISYTINLIWNPNNIECQVYSILH